jgi:hypothetical protein
MNTPAGVVESIGSKIDLMCSKLKALQNSDGGFKGFYCNDVASGVWSTAEIIHLVTKDAAQNTLTWLKDACEYLIPCQNPDGGWPFRKGGKSITDITAWCCLALSHFGYADAITRGVHFILRARNNEGSSREDAWGLTAYEEDRVYSTWIASYCLHRLLRKNPELLSEQLATEVNGALEQSRMWMLKVMNLDGSWSPTSGVAHHHTSTAVALLTLFIQGEDPANFLSSYAFLKGGIHHGLWSPEDEIVVTQEGYELPQQWFTSALTFRAMIFFAEMGIATIEEIDGVFTKLVDLIEIDGCVTLTLGSSANLIWTIPYMIDALKKYHGFILSKQREYGRFLEHKSEQRIRAKREQLDSRLRTQFPYPVSAAFSAFQHELDYHRKFQLMLQMYEVTIKYAALVGLSGYLLAKERNDPINELLKVSFKRPSLGDWTRLLESLATESSGFSRLLHPLTGRDLTRPLGDYLETRSQKTNLNQVLANITKLRNTNSGHGAIRTLYEYKLMVEEEEPKLYSFFDRVAFLSKGNSFLVLTSEYDEFGEGDRYKIRIFKGLNISDNNLETSSRLSEGQRESLVRYIYFQNTDNGTIVNLYPFLSYMFCEDCKCERFFFYNGTRTTARVAYLSYTCGHTVERDNGMHFTKRLSASEVSW